MREKNGREGREVEQGKRERALGEKGKGKVEGGGKGKSND